jgi:hypothetical protein
MKTHPTTLLTLNLCSPLLVSSSTVTPITHLSLGVTSSRTRKMVEVGD